MRSALGGLENSYGSRWAYRIKRGVNKVYSKADFQLCVFYKIRNTFNKVRREDRDRTGGKPGCSFDILKMPESIRRAIHPTDH